MGVINSRGYCGRSSVGRASPCQGEGRRFETGRPLRGDVAEWLGKGLQNPVPGFDSRRRLGDTMPPPRALSSVGERFLDAEEVGSSILPAPTVRKPLHVKGFWSFRGRSR